MPTKHKGRTKDVPHKSSGSSSEDNEKNKTRNVPTRNYQKKRREKKGKPKVGELTGYEGDSEPTCDSSVPSDTGDAKMSMDEYEFNEPDLPGTVVNKSGGRKTNKQPASKNSKSGHKRTASNKSQEAKLTTVPTAFITDDIMNESGIEISFRSGSQPGSIVKVMQHPLAKSTPALKRLASEMRDSDYSPQPFKMPRFMSGETSTPSHFSRPMNKMVMDDCFGFDSLQSPQAMPSPVRRVITPMSDYGSITPSGFDTPSQHSQFSKSDHRDVVKLDLQVMDSKPKKEKKPRKNYKQWVKEKSSEFSEIENFELCIE